MGATGTRLWPLALSAGLLAGVTSCEVGSPSQCHQRMLERLGCCPTCDADCRATITRECADELHESPVPDDGDEPGDDLEDAEPEPGDGPPDAEPPFEPGNDPQDAEPRPE